MKVIIIILQAILNLVRKRRDLIANRSKIPPEYRDNVVVWYSPKKQRLTNYDVIERYAEDFTYWTINNTSITSAQKKIVIPAGTELEYVIAYRGFNSSTDGFDIKYTGNAVIIYKYNKEDGTEDNITINKSGIYHLPASVRTQKNFGFYCNPQTVTEETTIEQLPTSILKDFSGNELDAYMYGFQGKLNSGVGIYAVDFTTYRKTSVVTDVSHNTVKVVPAASNYLFIRYATTEMPAYTVNVQNLGNNVLTYQYATENGRREITLTEGINEIPESIKVDNPYQVGLRVNAGTGEITITQIPDYPNSLCYAGKQYCKAYGLPILNDYTIIARRTWFDKTGVRCFCSKYKDSTVAGLFRFEWVAGNKEYTSSLGKDTNVVFVDSNITWQTKTSYNGKALTNLQYEDGEHLIIANRYEGEYNTYIGCHDDIIIFKRSLTINEINDITEAIFNETIIEE
jgi:hypothetical protein